MTRIALASFVVIGLGLATVGTSEARAGGPVGIRVGGGGIHFSGGGVHIDLGQVHHRGAVYYGIPTYVPHGYGVHHQWQGTRYYDYYAPRSYRYGSHYPVMPGPSRHHHPGRYDDHYGGHRYRGH